MNRVHFARMSRRCIVVCLTACAIGVTGVRAQDKSAVPSPAAAAPATSAAPAATSAPVLPKIDTLKRIRDTNSILIGVREASVPFSFIDGQKQPQGYSVDLCLRISEAIKSDLKMRAIDVKF